MALKDARSSAADVVLHAAAASCECSNSSLACSGKLVSFFVFIIAVTPLPKLGAQEGSQAVVAVGHDFCLQTCQFQCNLVTVLLYSK